MSEPRSRLTPGGVAALLGIGIVAGFLSGMFGVGGGIIIVPGLIAVAGFSQRLASGTSLTAIVPLASVGVISYASSGDISTAGGLVLALGAMVGARLGTWILARIKVRPLQLIFVGFMVLVIISLFLVVPSRDATFKLTLLSSVLLLAVGFVTGVLSGLLGIGGGVIVVPALIILFGFSDLVAKGTSLLMMIPTALTGTLANVRHGNVDVPAALLVGLPACGTTFLGSLAAKAVSPALANTLFAIFLSAVALQLLWKALRKPEVT